MKILSPTKPVFFIQIVNLQLHAILSWARAKELWRQWRRYTLTLQLLDVKTAVLGKSDRSLFSKATALLQDPFQTLELQLRIGIWLSMRLGAKTSAQSWFPCPSTKSAPALALQTKMDEIIIELTKFHFLNLLPLILKWHWIYF